MFQAAEFVVSEDKRLTKSGQMMMTHRIESRLPASLEESTLHAYHM